MSEILTNTGAKLWSKDDYSELWLDVFEQITGTGGRSNFRLIDGAIGKINTALDGYYLSYENNRLYICKDNEDSSITKLPISLVDSTGNVASTVDGTTIAIDENGVIHSVIDDVFSLTSTNSLQNKVITEKFDEVEGKIAANETAILSHVSDTNNPHGVTKSQVGLGNVEDKSSETIRGEITKDNVTTALGYTPYTPNEVDNKLSALETNIDWKEAVATYDDIVTTYPNPDDGWTVNTKDNNITYRYNGTEWIAISANAIPKATDDVDGLLSKEDHVKYEDANSKKHTHDNKTALDKLGESTEGNLTFNGEEIKAAQMTGATSTTDGVSGTVPAPLQGQEEYVLKGDGTWGEVNTVVDSELSTESSNAIANKAVANAISQLNTGLDSLNSNFLTSSKSVYVDATNGNDTTGDGTQENPWATIQKAVDECPSVTTKHSLNYLIYVADGVYDTLYIAYKKIYIYGLSDSPNITIGTLSVDYNSIVYFNCPIIFDTGSFSITRNRYFAISNSKVYFYKDVTFKNTRNETTYGLRVDGSNVVCLGTMTIDNLYTSIYFNNASIGNIKNLVTTNPMKSINDVTADGGFILLESSSIAGSKVEINGGRIYYGTSGWELIGSVTGQNSIAIDSDVYNEFLIEQNIDGVIVTHYIASNQLSSTGKSHQSGGYKNSTINILGIISCYSTHIINAQFNSGGTDYTSATTMTVYGRRA